MMGGRRSPCRNKARRWSKAVQRGQRNEQRDGKCVWLRDRRFRKQRGGDEFRE